MGFFEIFYAIINFVIKYYIRREVFMLDQIRDLQLIFKRYLDKALKGSKYAMMYVADCFLYGWGTSTDVIQYKEWLNKAATMGVSKALERLFYEALGMNDCLKAENILTLWGDLSEAGKCELLNCYERTSEIYKVLPQKSVQGMIDAFSKDRFSEDWAFEEALCYQFGYGVEKNSSKTAEIIVNYLGNRYDFPDLIANVVGLYDIGDITETQVGTHLYKLMCKVDVFGTVDSLKHPNQYVGYTERLMIFAACAGNVESQIMMAHLYLGDGIGLIGDNEYVEDIEALRWLLTSLYNGGEGEDCKVSPALVLLADKLSKKGDYANAFKGFYALAEYGFIPAYRIVGTYYYSGYGVQKDYMQAGQWWLKAAQNNEENAISIVNDITEMGDGDYWTGMKMLITENTQNSSGIHSSSNNSQGQSNGRQTQTSGGCYVATCVYGSYDCPEVWTLRRFRDYYLAETWYGRLFIKLYYVISPLVVCLFGRYSFFRNFWRRYLDKIVYRLREKGFKSTKYFDRDWN